MFKKTIGLQTSTERCSLDFLLQKKHLCFNGFFQPQKGHPLSIPCCNALRVPHRSPGEDRDGPGPSHVDRPGTSGKEQQKQLKPSFLSGVLYKKRQFWIVFCFVLVTWSWSCTINSVKTQQKPKDRKTRETNHKKVA